MRLVLAVAVVLAVAPTSVTTPASAADPGAEVVVGALATVVGTTAVADGAWHNVAVTRSGTGVVLYVDGAVDRTVTLSSAHTSDAASPGTEVVLGRDLLHRRNGLVGGLDEVAVHPTALTAQQVAAHQAAR